MSVCAVCDRWLRCNIIIAVPTANCTYLSFVPRVKFKFRNFIVYLVQLDMLFGMEHIKY